MKNKVLFTVLFGIAALMAMQFNFSAALGAPNQYFTFFQFFGPIAGGFLGPLFGMAGILLAQIANAVLFPKEMVLIDYLRFAPMLFAAFYFGAKAKGNWVKIAVPLAAMALFWAHPAGAQAWYYALYWTVPIIALLAFKNSLFAKSLGATFTAHSIGAIIWLYSLPTTPGFWTSLVPIVAYERLLFAAGIAVSYVAFNTLFHKLERALPEGIIQIDDRYVLSRSSLRL